MYLLQPVDTLKLTSEVNNPQPTPHYGTQVQLSNGFEPYQLSNADTWCCSLKPREQPVLIRAALCYTHAGTWDLGEYNQMQQNTTKDIDKQPNTTGNIQTQLNTTRYTQMQQNTTKNI